MTCVKFIIRLTIKYILFISHVYCGTRNKLHLQFVKTVLFLELLYTKMPFILIKIFYYHMLHISVLNTFTFTHRVEVKKRDLFLVWKNKHNLNFIKKKK